MSFIMVDTASAMSDLVAKMMDLPTRPPSIYLDLEGADLSRHGTINIIQIHLSGKEQTYLVDIDSLDASAFSTKGPNGTTLKSVFEDPSIPKVLFDVRNDADALYALYGISLVGVQDVQVMEVATRPLYRRETVNGLARCIQRDAGLSSAQSAQWESVKSSGSELFAPEKGGSYEAFRERPLNAKIAAYCVQDVLLLPRLYQRYRSRLTDEQWEEVIEFSENRAALSKLPNYIAHGRQKALSPWSRSSAEFRARVASQTTGTAPRAGHAKTKSEEMPKSAGESHTFHGQSTGSEDDARSRSLSSVEAQKPSESGTLALESLHLDDCSEMPFSELGEDHGDFGGFEDYGWRFEDESASEKDYTACSADFCGNCGRCEY